jgi:hypothetical protein
MKLVVLSLVISSLDPRTGATRGQHDKLRGVLAQRSYPDSLWP